MLCVSCGALFPLPQFYGEILCPPCFGRLMVRSFVMLRGEVGSLEVGKIEKTLEVGGLWQPSTSPQRNTKREREIDLVRDYE